MNSITTNLSYSKLTKTAINLSQKLITNEYQSFKRNITTSSISTNPLKLCTIKCQNEFIENTLSTTKKNLTSKRYLSKDNKNKDKKRKKVTLNTLKNLYNKKQPIAMITAHDYASAIFAENGKVDTVLVGDSLGMVTLGYDTTNPVTMEDMISHCKAVSRGLKTPFLICDMPFGSYEVSPQEAVRNAIRLIAEGQAEAVKLEGGKEMVPTIKAITKVGIPVIGHIGLTPQRTNSLGGFRVQGKTIEQAKELLEDALALKEAGCFGVVLEAMPAEVATFITEQLGLLTIGIGSGPGCSGQVLVQQDMLGSFDKFVPKFCKVYANVSKIAIEAIQNYTKDVKEKKFPNIDKNCYRMKAGEDKKILDFIKNYNKNQKK